MALMWDRGPEAVTQMWNRQEKNHYSQNVHEGEVIIYTYVHAKVIQFVGNIYCDPLLVFNSIDNNSVFL